MAQKLMHESQVVYELPENYECYGTDIVLTTCS